ncbi:MAG TPA: aminomethyltransferase family protein [Terriglobia bacterium]|nr:aminomethyltransferase family protein [Terriglobia bacterium]
MADLIKSFLAADHLGHGATLGEYHGALVPLRFSEPNAEHRAVRSAAGLFDFSFRSQFAVKGEHRVRFLHRIVSNDVKNLAPGEGTYATLLNAQGHILVDFRIYVEADQILVDTDADLRDKAMQSLQRYIIGDRVTIEPVDVCALAIQGPAARGLLDRALAVSGPLQKEYDHVLLHLAEAPVRVARATSTGEEGYEVRLGRDRALDVWRLLLSEATNCGALACGTEALESLRIEAGIPRYGPDLGEDTLPLEAGLYNALSFTKGCYIGQEIVERARSRGHVNWKLVGLLCDAAAAVPVAGGKLTAGGPDGAHDKALGEVTSACFSPTLRRPIALAYVRREATEPGTKLALASGAMAEVTGLPFYRRATEEAPSGAQALPASNP